MVGAVMAVVKVAVARVVGKVAEGMVAAMAGEGTVAETVVVAMAEAREAAMAAAVMEVATEGVG